MSGALLVAGTTSDAGKSVVTAGICRWLKRQGVKVAPFKAQNMSLNSFVTLDGAEIGRAQAMQAAEVQLQVDAGRREREGAFDRGDSLLEASVARELAGELLKGGQKRGASHGGPLQQVNRLSSPSGTSQRCTKQCFNTRVAAAPCSLFEGSDRVGFAALSDQGLSQNGHGADVGPVRLQNLRSELLRFGESLRIGTGGAELGQCHPQRQVRTGVGRCCNDFTDQHDRCGEPARVLQACRLLPQRVATDAARVHLVPEHVGPRRIGRQRSRALAVVAGLGAVVLSGCARGKVRRRQLPRVRILARGVIMRLNAQRANAVRGCVGLFLILQPVKAEALEAAN